MNKVVRVNFSDKEAFFPWKQDILLSGKCRGVLPLGIVSSEESISGFYSTEGYIRVSSLYDVKAADILTVAERGLECAEICRDALIFPGEYVLSADTLYISDDFREARIAYIPEKRYISQEGALSCFIYSLKKHTTENGRTYLDTLGSMLEIQGVKIYRVISFIEELKEEIKICGIC